MNNQSTILATKPSPDYELLDSGVGEKLERFGEVTLRRPDPQALWAKKLPAEKWENADAIFVNSGRSGVWKKKRELPESWAVKISGNTFLISLSAFKHVGVFPEQTENWNWITETISREIEARKNDEVKKTISVINLFGYTGGATLAAARGGANVCHVDGSKVSVARARENALASGLDAKPIRWIIDDAMAFVKREVRRGSTYDAIIMDPPSYGHGPKKELWEIENHLPEFISECQKILNPKPLFVLINGYAAGYSGLTYKNVVSDLIGDATEKTGTTEFGELALESSSSRLLPAGIFARWSRGV